MHLLIILGLICIVIGGIGLLIAAFRESILWGLACLFLHGIVSLIFVILHWQEAKGPFLLQTVGIVLILIGAFTATPHGAPATP